MIRTTNKNIIWEKVSIIESSIHEKAQNSVNKETNLQPLTYTKTPKIAINIYKTPKT